MSERPTDSKSKVYFGIDEAYISDFHIIRGRHKETNHWIEGQGSAMEIVLMGALKLPTGSLRLYSKEGE